MKSRIRVLGLVALLLVVMLSNAVSRSPAAANAEKSEPPVEMCQRAAIEFSKSLQSKDLRRLVQQETAALANANEDLRCEAVLFFCDLRARPVLLAALRSRDLSASTVVVQHGMDAFTIEDVPSLYETALVVFPDVLESDGETNVMRSTVIDKLASRTSALLGIEHKPIWVDPNEAGRKEKITKWWKEAVGRAGTGNQAAIRALRAYFARL